MAQTVCLLQRREPLEMRLTAAAVTHCWTRGDD